MPAPSRLHFALQPHGLLFLGKAEMLLSHTTLFTPLDAKRRFFRRALAEDRSFRGGHETPATGDGDPTGARLTRAAQAAGPAAEVVLDAGSRVASVNRRAGALFGVGDRDVGTPFRDLELSYRPADLRSAVDLAGEQRETVMVRAVRLGVGEASATLDVHVVPLFAEDGARLGTTLRFEDVSATVRLRHELSRVTERLDAAYRELQSSSEELETTTEELQSTNEELQSMNDELQSTNHELRGAATEVDELNAFMEAVLAGLPNGVAVTDSCPVRPATACPPPRRLSASLASVVPGPGQVHDAEFLACTRDSPGSGRRQR